MRFFSLVIASALGLLAGTANACPTYSQQGATYSYQGAQLAGAQSLSVIAGGSDNLSNCPMPGIGFVATAPDFTFYLSGMGAYALDLSVVSQCDATLLVNTADAHWLFDDDSNGNLDPRLQITGSQQLEGRVDVWVGSYDGRQCQATLTLRTTQLGGTAPQTGGKPDGSAPQPQPAPPPTAPQPPATQPAAPQQPAAASFVGQWSTNQGTLVLSQSGGRLSGSYGSGGTMIGTQSGNRLVGTYVWNGNQGQFELTLSPDGNSFSGTWARPGANGTWTGSRR